MTQLIFKNKRINAAAIAAVWPEARVHCSIIGNDTHVFWDEKIIPAVTENEIVQAQDDYELDITYKSRRANEYPPITDQLDAIWKQLGKESTEGKEFIPEAEDILQKIEEVKTKYPKPDETP